MCACACAKCSGVSAALDSCACACVCMCQVFRRLGGPPQQLPAAAAACPARPCRVACFHTGPGPNVCVCACVCGYVVVQVVVYFRMLELCVQQYTVGVKKRTHSHTHTHTRAVYFSELDLAEIYGSGQQAGKSNLQVFRACRHIRFGSKNMKTHLQVFCPDPCISASSSLQKYTVRVKTGK